MKISLPLGLRQALLTAMAFGSLASTTVASDLGNMMFVGDSITAAGGYQQFFFKNVVDNGGVYTPVGPAGGNTSTYYNGVRFSSASAGYSSWKAADLAGLTVPPGTDYPNTDHAYLKNWLGLSSTMTGGGTYTGNVYSPDTMCIMAGTNDVSWGNLGSVQDRVDLVVNSLDTMVSDAKTAGVSTIYVCSVPVSSDPNRIIPGTSTHYNEAYKQIDAVMSDAQRQKDMGYVWIDTMIGLRAAEGVSPAASNFAFSDGIHPNSQGHLIIAGNMARGMGTGQRSVLQTRKAAQSFTGHLSSEGTSTATPAPTNWLTGPTNISQGYLVNTLFNVANADYLQVSWAEESLGNYTCDISMQMFAAGGESNLFSIMMGNGGSQNFRLDILNDKIQFINGSSSSTLYLIDTTLQANDYRIAYIGADSTKGINAGFYVWFNGVLIGEALGGTNLLSYKGLQVGSLSSGLTYAGVVDVSWDTTGSWAPDYSSLGNKSDAFGSEKLGGFETITTEQEPSTANLVYTPGSSSITLNPGDSLWASATGGALQTQSGNILTKAGEFKVGGVVGKDITVSGVISGTGTLVKEGENSLKITSKSTYLGETKVKEGTLVLSGAANGYATLQGPISVYGGATLVFDVNEQMGWQDNYSSSITLYEGAVFDIRATYNTFKNIAITLQGAEIKGGNLLTMQGSSSINSLASEQMSSINAPIKLGTNIDFSVAKGVTASGIDLQIKGRIEGVGALTKLGAGTMELLVANNYTGETWIKAGTLRLNQAGTLGTGGVNIEAQGTLEIANTFTLNSQTNIINKGTLVLTETGKLSFASGLDGNKTYITGTSGQFIHNGVIDLGGYYSLDQLSKMITGSLSGSGVITNWLASTSGVTPDVAGNISLEKGTGSDKASFGQISGSLRAGAGITLSTGDISGSVTVADGAQLSNSGMTTLSGSGSITVKQGADDLMTISGENASAEGLVTQATAANKVSLQGSLAKASVQVNNSSLTASGDVRLDSSSSVNGTGSLSTGAHTVISDASMGIAVEVNNGGTFKGQGSLNQGITVNQGGHWMVGNSPGVVEVSAGALIQTGGGVTFAFDLSQSASGLYQPGNGYANNNYSQMWLQTGDFSLEDSVNFILEYKTDQLASLSTGGKLNNSVFLYDIILAEAGAGLTLGTGTAAVEVYKDGVFALDWDAARISQWLGDNISLEIQALAGTNTLTQDELNSILQDTRLSFVQMDNKGYAIRYQVQYIPEPSSATLGILGLSVLLLRRRRERV